MKAIIPFNAAAIAPSSSLTDVQSVSLQSKRTAILEELRCVPSLVKMAGNLKQDEVYKIVFYPEGGKLFKDNAGHLKGVFYKDGKILEHAKFSGVQPSVVKAASAIGSQILLVSIAMQLNRIEKGIARIITEFHNDRIGEIASGINLHDQAMQVIDPEKQALLIANSIATLNTGIEKTLKALRQQIEDAPDPKFGYFDNWLSNKSTIASEKLSLAEESFTSCLLGIQTLVKCYATINEPKAASKALRTYLNVLDSCEIESAANKARLVPRAVGAYPEEIWLSYLANKPLLYHQIASCEQLAADEFDCIEIEVKPSELREE